MHKILFIQTAFIGDVILATSLVEKWKSTYPASSVHFLLRKGNESILENNPHIEKIHVWEKKSAKWSSYYSLIKMIRKEEYSHLFNLHRFFSSGFLSFLSKAKYTSGFTKNPMSFFYSKKWEHKIGTDENPIHEIERNQKLISQFTEGQPSRPKLYPSETDFDKVRILGPYITISPGSVWFTKQWPAGKWTALMDQINNNFKVFLLGGNNDIKLCNMLKINSSNKQVEIRAGQLSLLQSAALMKGAAMNFVNDSAPLHLASAVDAPVTALFCSTLPSFGFTPLSEDAVVLETKENLGCRPCGLHGKKACPKRHFKCSNIEIQALLDRLK
ncbi:MAG: glycosyltransferase family 9 protein [Bacteroidota bacterium]